MIKFYAPENQIPTEFTNSYLNGGWGFEAKEKNYIDKLSGIKSLIILKIELHLMNASESTYKNNLINVISSLKETKSPEYIFTGDLVKEIPECDDYSDLICRIDAINLKIDNTTLKPSELKYFGQQTGDFNDKFQQKFQEYYMQAKQLNNFNCGFLPAFRNCNTFMNGIPAGDAFGYLDIQVQKFLDYLKELYNYINRKTTKQISDCFNTSWDGNMSYILTLDSFNNRIRSALADFSSIIKNGDLYLDSLQIGLKIIATANIILTSDSQDDGMFMEQSKIGPSSFQNLNSAGLPKERWLLIREIQAASYCTQITLDIKSRLKPDFSNFEFLLSKAINISLNQFGIGGILNNLNNSLDYQR